jgi:hypothetical protein
LYGSSEFKELTWLPPSGGSEQPDSSELGSVF